MYLDELVNIIGGKTKLSINNKIHKISIDTRNLKKNDVFIALKGKKYDGHNFIEEARKKGCIACIVDNDIDDEKCIKVNNTYDTLFDIGNYIRNKHSIPLIAITGSNGKTTTKELLVHILKAKYNILYNKYNNNNLIGIFNTLINLNKKHDIIVMELGSNHLGEISVLSKLCNPNVGIITNIGSSHLKYFKTRKNIFKEKLSVLDGMKQKKLIINGDDKYLKKLDFFKCGTKENNDLIAYNIEEKISSISFYIKLDKEYKINFNNPGKHFVTDILLVIKICLEYNISIKTIIKRISSFKNINNRMNILKIKNNTIVDDTYNASLESIKAGINYMKKIPDNKVFIIGEILELGKYKKNIHKKINNDLKNINNKEVYTVGNIKKYIDGKNFKDVNCLIEYLNNNKINNKYIYIKGSRKVKLDRIVEYLKKS